MEEKGNEEPLAKTTGDEKAPAKRNGKFKEPIMHCLSKTSWSGLTLSMRECLMKFFKVTLTFEYEDEIL